MKRRSVLAPRKGALGVQVAEAIGASLADATALVLRGAVYVRGRRCEDPTREVEAQAPLTVVLEEGGRAAAEAAPARRELEVLFEDERLLVVNKPAGIAAQPTPSRSGDDLLALASAHLGREAGLVHRLDKETTGVTVFGKTKEATRALAAEFKEGRAKKTYLAAVVAGLAPEGQTTLPLSRDPARPGRWRATKSANGLAAATAWKRLAVSGPWALVALFPATGRTHQLRAHLTALGSPILGDKLYRGPPLPPGEGEPPPQRCLLHAFRLEVLGARYEAPVPEDLARYFAQAGVHAHLAYV